ncbi:nitroreductase family protein [Thermosulfurimonas marina]|uniref:Nitroreductase family protein n=1 Tax=Thermosulfurimonas marina TaxID=2047767 RepID=A0A6H1WRL0_9BACT|nr:nitroreductase family protein [Thermosulfurimonas marina]QJA05776.1 nitroreductase family protein [Thermosulfurimonas marina]
MEVITAIRGRRAINYFDPQRPVPEELLRNLLELAALAPSSFNLQPWRVIVVDDPEKKALLRECAMGQPKVEEAPVVLILVADPGVVEEYGEEVLRDRLAKGYLKDESQIEGVKAVFYQLYGDRESLRRKLFAVKNTALFAMNLMLAARGLGLETHPMDGFEEPCVKRVFGIPEDKLVPMLVAVGYPRPGVKLLERPARRPPEVFTSRNTWSTS